MNNFSQVKQQMGNSLIFDITIRNPDPYLITTLSPPLKETTSFLPVNQNTNIQIAGTLLNPKPYTNFIHQNPIPPTFTPSPLNHPVAPKKTLKGWRFFGHYCDLLAETIHERRATSHQPSATSKPSGSLAGHDSPGNLPSPKFHKSHTTTTWRDEDETWNGYTP